jgi:acyl-CoA thioesterase FadM
MQRASGRAAAHRPCRPPPPWRPAPPTAGAPAGPPPPPPPRPPRGDLIELETWFQDAGKLAAQRDWLLRDKRTGQLLGRATSTWVMINMNTRRLTKMPPEILAKSRAFKLVPPKHAIAEQYTRLKLPELDMPAEVRRGVCVHVGECICGWMGVGGWGGGLDAGCCVGSAGAARPVPAGASPSAERRPHREPSLSPSQIVGPIQVARRSDMDMNGHINNVTYLAWVLETVPREVYSSCHLYQVRPAYSVCYSRAPPLPAGAPLFGSQITIVLAAARRAAAACPLAPSC